MHQIAGVHGLTVFAAVIAVIAGTVDVIAVAVAVADVTGGGFKLRVVLAAVDVVADVAAQVDRTVDVILA